MNLEPFCILADWVVLKISAIFLKYQLRVISYSFLGTSNTKSKFLYAVGSAQKS